MNLHYISFINQYLFMINPEERDFLFEIAVDMFCITDMSGNILDMNSAWEGTLGFTINEIKANSYIHLVHPADAEKTLLEIQKLSHQDLIVKFENRYKCKDGSYKWLSWKVRSNESMSKLYAIARDITELKENEKKVEALSHFKQTIVDSANFTIISTDENGLITSFNRTAEEKLGYRAEEVIGITTPDIFHDKSKVEQQALELSQELHIDLKAGFEVFVAKSKLGIFSETEWTYIRKDGFTFPVLLSVTPIFNEFREITGFLGVGQDLTEKKEMERKSKEDQHFIKSIGQSLPLTITIIDADNLKIYYSNGKSKFINNDEYSKVGKSDLTFLESLIHPEDLPVLLEKYQTFVNLKDGEVEDSELRIKSKNGRWCWLSLKASVFERMYTGKVTKVMITTEDVTDKKEFEIKVKENHIFLKQSQEIAHVGSFEWYITPNKLYWSEELYNIFGYENGKEMDYTVFIDRIHPEDIQRTNEAVANALKNIAPFDTEYRVLLPTNEIKYVWAKGKTYFNEEGKALKMIGTALDITEKKKLMLDLETRESLLNESQEIANVGSFEWDIINNKIFWTKQSYRLWGYSEGEKLDYAAFERIIHPEDKAKVTQAINDALENVAPYNIEYRIITRAGIERYIWAKGKTFYNNEGKAFKIIGAVVDITEKKIAQLEIEQKSQMLQGILKSMPVVIYRIDQDGIIRESQGMGLSYLGLSDHQMVGRNIKESEYYDHIGKALKGESVNFLTTSHVNDKEWYFDNYLFPDTLRNGGVIGFSLNVTEAKLAQKELEKTKEQAVRANLSKSRFLANMSHELRTPISAILGLTEVLKKDMLKDDQKEYLQYIISSGDILLKLIGDILDLSKIEEGKFELNEETFHFKELFTSTLFPYKFKANEQGLTFSINFDDNIPAYLIGDVSRIKQVIINLIGNALKFTQEGNVAIDFRLLNNPATDGEAELQISVSDTGIGIPADKQIYVFDSFTQADTSVNRQYGGSGLGLSIVKEVVKLLGGTINLVSPSGLSSGTGGPGSIFEFVFKLKVGTQNELSSKDDYHQSIKFQSSVKILLVEDNLVNQKLAEILLKDSGCQLQLANNGEEAVAIALENDFTAILMDVQMPKMNGLIATKILREKRISIPIIGLTANVSKEDVTNCFKAGMDDYLSKPYNEKQLYSILSKWINRTQLVNNTLEATKIAEIKKGESVKDYKLDSIYRFSQNNIDAVIRVIEAFIDVTPGLINELELSLKEWDIEKIKEIAHRLKSTIAIFEINSLNEKVQILSTCSEKHSKDLILENGRNVLMTLKKVQKSLQTELESLREFG